MKHYTVQLRGEMEEIEGKQLTTPQGHQITFRMKLIPCDMKWASSMSGELNNCACYFSPFANVNKDDKTTMDGSIGGPKDTWQEWEYEKRIATAKKVEKLKAILQDPSGKQRNQVTKLISKEKSRQEFVPPLGKFVNLIKAEPLHNTNNAWQQWFTNLLTVVMQYTDNAQLKSATSLSDMPHASPLIKFLTRVRETAKCGRLYNSFVRWFGEKRKKGISFSYRFTGLESKNFSWNFAFLIKEVLSILRLSQSSVLQIHALAFVGLKLRDSASIYSRVVVSKAQVDDVKTLCQDYFKANVLFLTGVNPTVWTLGYAIPHHTKQLFEELGHGLGLNSMQGREAKHVKLASYIKNTCNLKKSLRWQIVFRHEYVTLIWLREMDPYSVSYKQGQGNRSESYIPKSVRESDGRFCQCGMLKSNDTGCNTCTSTITNLIRESVATGKVVQSLKNAWLLGKNIYSP